MDIAIYLSSFDLATFRCTIDLLVEGRDMLSPPETWQRTSDQVVAIALLAISNAVRHIRHHLRVPHEETASCQRPSALRVGQLHIAKPSASKAETQKASRSYKMNMIIVPAYLEEISVYRVISRGFQQPTMRFVPSLPMCKAPSSYSNTCKRGSGAPRWRSKVQLVGY